MSDLHSNRRKQATAAPAPSEQAPLERGDELRQIASGAQADEARALVGEPQVQADAVGQLNGDKLSIHEAAARGVSGSGGELPHAERIQASFGGAVDVGSIVAHVGGAASEANEQIGANAYARGSHVAFKSGPSLHTAAHEAAHVVQQRAGVQLEGGLGKSGDRYEQQADAIADRVVQGKSAADLVQQAATSHGAGSSAVQKEETAPSAAQAERIRNMAKMRDEYEAEVKALRGVAASMQGNKSEEEIARHVSAERRKLGIKYKDLTPADKREQIYARNLKKYGDKLGPTPDYLRGKGKSWGDITEGACNPGGEDIIPRLLAAGLGRPDLESAILSGRGGGSSTWFDVISGLTSGI